MFRFHLKCFLSHVLIIFIVVLEHSESLARLGPILFTCGADKTGKIVIYLVPLIIFTRNKQHAEQRKRENSIGVIARLTISDH